MVQKIYMLGDPVDYRQTPYDSWKSGVITSHTISAAPCYSVRTDEGLEVQRLLPEQLRADDVRLAEFCHREMGDAA